MATPSRRPLRRLNPFAFVAETNIRFTLLIFASVIVILYVALLSGSVLAGAPPRYQSPPADLPFDVYAEQIVMQLSSQLIYYGVETILLAGLAGVTFWLAWHIYRRHPRRIRRQKNLKPLDAGKDSRFDQAYGVMVAVTGIVPPQEVEITEDSHLTDAQAFGLKGRYVLRLGGRMRMLMRKSPAVFQAIMFHELAHIANGDVGRAYFTQALWVAMLAIAIIPATLVVIGQFAIGLAGRLTTVFQGGGFDLGRFFFVNLPVTLLTLLQIGALVALLASIRASVLRTREVYADWRAALWGAEEGLHLILRGQKPKKAGWWRQVWQLHPSSAQRRDLLRDPALLFQLSLDIPIFAGMLVAITLPGISWIVSQIGLVINAIFLIAGTILAGGVASGSYGILGTLAILVLALFTVVSFLFFIGPLFFVGYLIASAVGLQLQRSVLCDFMNKGRAGCAAYSSLGGYAMLMASGFLLGSLVTPINVLVPIANIFGSTLSLGRLIAIPLETILWLVVASLIHWVWMVHLRHVSGRLLGAHTGYKPPRGKQKMLSVVMGLLLGLAYVPMLILLIWVFRNVSGLASILPLGTLVLIMGGALAMYGLFALLVSFAVEFWVRVDPQRCPRCAAKARMLVCVGKICNQCGSDLTPWLFSDPPAYARETGVHQHLS